MKASLLKTIRHSEKEDRRSRINYKVITFLVCLVIAALLWLMNALSKKYTDTLTFHVQYQNLPQDKKLYPATASLYVKVASTGYNIASYTLGIRKAFLNVDASQFRHKNDQYIYSLENKIHLGKIEDQLGEEMKVIDVAPDTLVLQLNPQD